MKDKNGFTLLELLTVIGIISILVVLLTVSYSAAQKRSRDVKRKGDIRAMQDALEQYYVNSAAPNTFKYPTTCSNASTYLKSSWPSDPINAVVGGVSYSYQTFCDADSYYLCARLEAANGNAQTASTDANGTSFVSGSGATALYYCLNNLQ